MAKKTNSKSKAGKVKAKTKTKKVKGTKKTKAAPTQAEVAPPAAPEVQQVVQTVNTIDETTDVSSEVSHIADMVKALITEGELLSKKQKTLTQKLRKCARTHAKQCKELVKNASKSKRRTKDPNKPKRPPSGFAKPTKISDALCDFLGVSHGELMARTEVTKWVTKYIREQKLQVETNKRRFEPDAKLASILGPLDGTKKDKNGKTDLEKGYTYFNLQKYLSPQFPKSAASASTSVSASAH